MSEHRLTPGSRYRIVSLASQTETQTNEGTFQGITSLGSIDALVLEVPSDGDEPLVRLIPTHTVVQLDVLEQAGEDEGDEEEAGMHYG